MITGKNLIAWGFAPGSWFQQALQAANEAEAGGADRDTIRAVVASCAPPQVQTLHAPGAVAFHAAIEAETEDEAANVAKVAETMAEVMRAPTVTGGAVMPDACPTGGLGTIPVGGVVETAGAIHPGMHSADICCSVAITVIGDVDPSKVLDAGAERSHFGGGGRGRAGRVALPDEIGHGFVQNRYLAPLIEPARDHFATQGDGNHFLYAGRLRSTGQVALVTHHGSRKPGAMLYKRGIAVAEAFRAKLSPETRRQNAWIPFDTVEGRDYWAALQVMRAWTKANHFAIHDLVLDAVGRTAEERFWNEHNFVFRRGDSFLHGKGATPAWEGFAKDSNGLVLIPLNMAEPILVARGRDKREALGFCPHGAGRNYSRSEDARRNRYKTAEERVRKETRGLDVRFWAGKPDAGELPSAYKRADAVVRQIRAFDLAEIVDYVDPYGCIMAGDWKSDFHRRRIEARRARRKERRP